MERKRESSHSSYSGGQLGEKGRKEGQLETRRVVATRRSGIERTAGLTNLTPVMIPDTPNSPWKMSEKLT